MPQLPPAAQKAVELLAGDLERVFGPRLRSLVAYPGNQNDGAIHSCALVDDLSFQDLARCLPSTDGWQRRNIAVPLLLSPEEWRRTLDIFPLEYAAILAAYAVVRGPDPFAGVTIPSEDVRRATEAQAKSHLIHLREAYLESRGEPTRIAQILVESAAPLRALLTNLLRLPDGAVHPPQTGRLDDEALARLAEARTGAPAEVIRDVLAATTDGPSTVADPSHLLARHIEAARLIWAYVDRWRA